MQGLAKVAAVNCDEDSNKPFCGSMGVQGFPTLKIVRPGKKPGRPVVEDYQGPRAAKAIVDAVVDKIPNHVQRVKDDEFDQWLQENNSSAKAILFTDKGTTSALLRALAIDYLGSIAFAQIRNKEEQAVDAFGISKFPTFVLLPGGEKESLVYDGEMKKGPMSDFLKQVAEPNPDSAPEAEKPKPKESKASKSKASPVSVDEPSSPSDAKAEEAPPMKVTELPSIAEVDEETVLEKECFTTKSHICILALLPAIEDTETVPSPNVAQALLSLGEIHQKHSKRHSLFPFYSVPARNPRAKIIRELMELKGDGELEIIAVNAKRSWWRRYSGSEFGHDSIEAWVDAIRMNEGSRETLPDSLIVEVASSTEATKEDVPPEKVEEDKHPSPEEPAPPVAEEEPEPEPVQVEFEQFSDEPADPEPEAEPAVHDEL